MPQTTNSTTLNKLLDSLGFDEWKTITAFFIIPFLNILGTLCCITSASIFFRRKFNDSVFYYYRLLCLVYIIHLLHNIPAGLLCTPRYYPQTNTRLNSLYLIYYIVMSSFLFHFEDVLQMAILLTRMKLFDLFVDKYFTFTPRVVSLTLFIFSFCINFPFVYSFKISSFGDFLDSSQHVNVTFYYFDASDFSSTLFGQILFFFTFLFLNLILSVVVGVGLNIFSLLKYKSHLRKDLREVCRLIQSSIHNRLTTTLEIQQFNERIKNQRKKEKNMLYMALTLCSISISSRIIYIFQYVYFFFFHYSNSLSDIITLVILYLLIQTLVPTVAIFVFFSFNKMFRKELQRLLGLNETT